MEVALVHLAYRLAVLVAVGMLLPGCAVKKTIMVLPLDGGQPIETIFTSGMFRDGRRCRWSLARRTRR
jgi:hypothetical protein